MDFGDDHGGEESIPSLTPWLSAGPAGTAERHAVNDATAQRFQFGRRQRLIDTRKPIARPLHGPASRKLGRSSASLTPGAQWRALDQSHSSAQATRLARTGLRSM